MSLLAIGILAYIAILILDRIEKKILQKNKIEKKAAYKQYLKTDTWADLKSKALNRDGNKCQKCGSTQRLEVHHRMYPINLGSEKLDWLITVCRDCHRGIHKDKKPIPREKISIFSLLLPKKSPPKKQTNPPSDRKTPHF